MIKRAETASPWGTGGKTARVLNHLRTVSNDKALKDATEQEQAAVERVWAFVGVKMSEYWRTFMAYGERSERQARVRKQLLT